MDLSKLKAQALKLSPPERVELIQAILESLKFEDTPTKPKVIDRENVPHSNPEFEIEADPVVLVPSISEAPKAIEIPNPLQIPEKDVETHSLTTDTSIAQSFQKLHKALRSSTEQEHRESQR